MTVGLVLGGGGARGNFQVGAVRYLYERGVRPAVIAGTSVGAINAIKLAEGEGDGSDPKRGLQGLIGIWRDLKVSTDMWVKEDWYRNVQNNDIYKFFESGDLFYHQASLENQVLSYFVPVVGQVLFFSDMIDLGKDIEQLVKDLKPILSGRSRSLYNLSPIQTKLSDPSKLDTAKVGQSGIKLRMSVVALESGSLRYVTESGKLLERDGAAEVKKGPKHSSQCVPIANKIADLERIKANLQAELNKASTSEKAALVEQIRQTAQEIARESEQLRSCDLSYPPPRSPLTVSLIQGTLASASIPMAFPTVKLDAENYVDGGVREVVPIDAAVKAGATEVYAILASDSTMDAPASALSKQPLLSFDVGAANMADVINRATSDIMGNEIGYNDLQPYLDRSIPGVNATVIRPDLDIHDIMTIDPGLIDIRIAHGYMRADDVYQAKQADPDRYLELAEQYSADRNTQLIVQTRYQIWKLEYAAAGWRLTYEEGRPKHPSPWVGPDLAKIREVRVLKNKLYDLIRERKQKGGWVPAESDSWSGNWERHPWTPERQLWLPVGPAAEGNDIKPGELLAVEQAIHSPNGGYSLVFQADGNLVQYKITRTQGPLSAQCQPIGTELARLETELANLQKRLQNAPTNEKGEIMEQIRECKAAINEKQAELTACNKVHPPAVNVSRIAVWATGTGGPVGSCYMSPDGNLLVYDELCTLKWSSNTAGNPGSSLVVQDDGNLVIYRPDGRAVWASKR